MKRRLIAILLGVALLVTAVFCVAAAMFSDTEGHWAASYIDEATSRGLFSGVGGNRFAPEQVMTRGMFVTVLGRTAGIDPEQVDASFVSDYFTDVQTTDYYAPFVAWAVSVGVTEGMGDGRFAPSEPVTREQMACFLRSFLDLTTQTETVIVAGGAPEESEIPLPPEELRRPEFEDVQIDIRGTRGSDIELPPDVFDDDKDFSDAEQIAAWARESVDRMVERGLFAGAPDGKGGYAFLPKKTATRAEGTVVFCNLQDLLAEQLPVLKNEVNNLVLNQDTAEVEAGQTLTLSATVFPMDATNTRVIWYSTDREVLTVDNEGCITAIAEGTAEVCARSVNGIEAACTVTVTPAPEPDVLVCTPREDLYAPLSWYDKCVLVFGTPLDDPRLAYSGNEEAKPHMTTIKVPAWDIGSNGEKYTRYFYLEIHENVADIVAQIFDEIYALPEQVPIHSLGGYRWDGKCEHSIGLAIDINPAENYYCKPDGTAVVGKYFKPGEDPYSIPVMGAVDQIFANYGFKRGIYWNSGYKDYMHYSYFGT